MAVRPGEENVATLFGDIHYFYGPPTAKPPHHRFDKGSYVYLFENANDRRARIEVANQPGSDDQDAFDGFLDHAHLRYSYKQQCLVTITVGDGVPDQSQWHLPTYDPHNQNKYHYKLHSLDIYFWTQNDALQFVNGIRRVLPGHQVEVLDEPAPPQQQQRQQYSPPHHDPVNPLVNKLENAVISDPPRFGAGTAGPIQAPAPLQGTNRSTPQQQQQHQGMSVPTFDPPPVSAVHGSSNTPDSPSGGFKPMAYNPAAPAAPEQIRHREKTPPPPEEDGLDLQTAVARDHQPQSIPYTPGFTGGGPMSPAYSIGVGGPMSPGFGAPRTPGFPPTATGPMSPGFPPTATGPMSPGFPPSAVASPGFPPSQFGALHRSATMPVTSAAQQQHQQQYGLASPGLPSPNPYGGGGAAPAYPGSPGFAPPPPSFSGPPPPASTSTPASLHQQQQSLSPPPGGYANYNYTTSSNPSGGPDYSIHSQVYRPTEQEAINHKHDNAGSYRPRSGRSGNADRLERGVTGMFKKLEKKLL
ncbi:hypothetical protein PG991_015901 [Apiospora marii]|uniref:RNA recognition motif-containing protein n=1 Tax=Apiospora marii TaxID=335849 RepID=A0ABR1QZZ8_9PEZI